MSRQPSVDMTIFVVYRKPSVDRGRPISMVTSSGIVGWYACVAIGVTSQTAVWYRMPDF